MYLAGVYFAPWSFMVTLFLLSVLHRSGYEVVHTQYLNGEITYLRAFRWESQLVSALA